jgi:hypothetical protein
MESSAQDGGSDSDREGDLRGRSPPMSSFEIEEDDGEV